VVARSAARKSPATAVEEVLTARLGPYLSEVGFHWLSRNKSYLRGSDAVAEVRLGISARPPSLGGSGVIVQPMIVVRVPAWEAEVANRLAGTRWERGAAVVWEALDWICGRERAWALGEGESEEAHLIAESILQALRSVGVPYLDQLSSPMSILANFETGEIKQLGDAAPTVACGALLAGRDDLARRALSAFGSEWRQELETRLGLK